MDVFVYKNEKYTRETKHNFFAHDENYDFTTLIYTTLGTSIMQVACKVIRKAIGKTALAYGRLSVPRTYFWEPLNWLVMRWEAAHMRLERRKRTSPSHWCFDRSTLFTSGHVLFGGIAEPWKWKTLTRN